MSEKMFGLSAEEKKIYNEATSNVLTPPLSAVEKMTKRGPVKRWLETVILRKLDFDGDIKMRNTAPGDECAAVKIRLEIDPTSESDNGGRLLFSTLRYNLSALRRGNDEPHAKMTRMAMQSFKSLLVALDYDPELGMQVQAFVEEYGPEIIGSKLTAIVSQYEDEEGVVRDNVDKFLKVRD